MLNYTDGVSQKGESVLNLHKKCYSVQDCATGRVIDHRILFTMIDVDFTVRNGGKERVRKEGAKMFMPSLWGVYPSAKALPVSLVVQRR